MDRPPLTEADIEAAVRAYLGRLARRYAPLLLGALALVLIVVLVPTATPRSGGSQTVASGATGLQSGGGYGGTTGTAPAAGGPAVGSAGSAAPAAGSSAGPAAASGGAAGAAGAAGPTAAAPVAPSHSGVARSGVHCGPGVRQVSWSVYAPPCVAKYTGNNGGATSHGVTGSTITLSFRLGNSQEDSAIGAAAGSAAPAPDSVFLQDMNTYISFFNKQFELYGRHVVLKPYQGQGDYISEDQGQGADRAQADAANAHRLGAFGDVTFPLKGSEPYWTSLAQQHVVAWGPLGFPDSYYQRYAPYWWSYNSSGTDFAKWLSNLTCRRLAGMKAVFSPDVAYQKENRVFGLIHPNNPEYIAVASYIKQQLSSCGVHIKREASYSINVVQYQQEATSTIAQMQSQGVTTVLCYCDPIVPIFLANAAQSQHYQPEWVQPYWGDPQVRQPDSGHWQAVLAMGAQWPTNSQNEAYRVYKMASGGKEPREQYYAVAYADLMQVFMGLQAAGPALTPQSLERGYFSLPDSGEGMAGKWHFQGGANAFAPQYDAPVGWYDPNMTSNFDGKKGGYRTCNSGAWYPFDQPDAWGGPREQLHCFGK